MRTWVIGLAVCIAALGASGVAAGQGHDSLAALFAELQSLDKRREQRAGELQAQIWRIWYQHDDAGVREAMSAGAKALAQQRYPDAIDAFTRALELDPAYAEAWNRRATTYYLMDRCEKALADIDRVLELEPRHFGALSGRGLCLREQQRPEAALRAFERALELNPHLDNVYLEILRIRSGRDQ